MGAAQFTQSHMINGGEKRQKRGRKVHRYPEAASLSQESQPVRRFPDDDSLMDQYGPAEEVPDTDLTHFQPQPSNDYADEAEPDYDEDGYGDDDDDEDDSSETRSRTFVASGTGQIPEDMRAEADDTPDVREVAADTFVAEREREADRNIHLYKQHEAE